VHNGERRVPEWGDVSAVESSFFEQPVLNSPYQYPARHWQLEDGPPTGQIVGRRRLVEDIMPIPKARKQKAPLQQQALVFDEGKGISTQAQQYDPTPIVNALREHVDRWRRIPDPARWGVTPETARLLQHWWTHPFGGVRPFFCQIEAVETAIWLTEVAPTLGSGGQTFLDHLKGANDEANPGLPRLALKAGDRRRQDHGHDYADRLADR
jgi:type III restriction enzyme